MIWYQTTLFCLKLKEERDLGSKTFVENVEKGYVIFLAGFTWHNT